MNEVQFKTLFPNASQSLLDANGFMKGGDEICSDVPVTTGLDQRQLAVQSTKGSGSNPASTFKPKRAGKIPNKTERAFEGYMQALRGSPLEFEPVKLRIGPNCYYTPDYGDLRGGNASFAEVVNSPGCPTFYEVKGGWITDDSMVKFKAAKERHTWASFEMWQRKAGTWSRLL